ncbi:transposase [Paractinoplanes ovalisporus]
MSKAWIVDDESWKLIDPLLPPWPQKSPGPQPVPGRSCLQGILFVLHTGIGWEDLPQELGAGTGPSPVNPGQRGSKDHLSCDGNGTPIYVLTSGANVPDVKPALDLLDCYPPIVGRAGRPRRRFATLLADKAYSSAAFRPACRDRGFAGRAAATKRCRSSGRCRDQSAMPPRWSRTRPQQHPPGRG